MTRKFKVSCKRLESNPFVLEWFITDVGNKYSWRHGTKSKTGWMSIDEFDSENRLSGYLGELWSSDVTASTSEIAMRIGIYKILKEIQEIFSMDDNYDIRKFIHVYVGNI